MKKLLILLALHTVQLFAAPPATVTVASTYYNADGSLFSGSLNVKSPPFSCNGVSVAGVDRTYTVTSGVVSVALVPNIGCVGTVGYTVKYGVGTTYTTRYWSIPASPSTTTIDAVQSSLQPSLGLHISLANLPFGNVTAGQVLGRSSDGTSWVGYSAVGEPTIAAGTINQYWRGDKTWQSFPTIPTNTSQLAELTNLYFTNARVLSAMSGLYVPPARTVAGKALSANITLVPADISLGNVDNTSDANKPVSSAQQTALDFKAPLASPTFTGAFNASGAASTMPIKTGISPPGTCGLGEVFFDTNATAGRNIYVCSGVNTWTEVNGTGTLYTAGAGLGLATDTFSVDDTTTPQWLPTSGAPTGACTAGTIAIDAAAHKLYYCDGAWQDGSSTYTLPAATGSVRGGITVGTGLTVTSDTLSVTAPIPSQTGNNGKYLTTDGTTASWATVSGGGGTTGLYSGTLAFSTAIPSGVCDSKVLVATGITTGKTLAVGLPSALSATLQARAVVTAADAVTVQLCNNGDTDITPGSATYSVRDMDSLGYLTATAAIDWGALVPGQCSTNDITLTGAATGDNVAAGWPSTLSAGLTARMIVTAANTVTAQLCNVVDTDIDMASLNYKAAITR